MDEVLKIGTRWHRAISLIGDILIISLPLHLVMNYFILPDQVKLGSIIASAVYLLYKIISEYRFHTTIGKHLHKLSIATVSGGSASFIQIVIRNFTFLLLTVYEMGRDSIQESTNIGSLGRALLVVCLVDSVVLIFHPQRRSLRDLVAGTVVAYRA
jgi:uncharacterized RDD family membrane protein YckC